MKRNESVHLRDSVSSGQVIDTHAHLDFDAFNPDRDEVISRARDAGLTAVINPGTDLAHSRMAVKLARQSSMVYAAVGVHPHEASTLTGATIEELYSLALDPRVVAIGEIGLDFYRDYAPRDIQREAFQAQLDLAQQVGKPVIVHDREAHGEVLATLRQRYNVPSGARTGNDRPSGVLHCFSGDLEMAQEAIRLGFYIGVDGPVTFHRASGLHGVVRQLPLDRLLIETDCPYLTPEPYRGRRNEPAYVSFVTKAIAELRSLAFEEVARATTANAHRVFELPGG